MIWLAVWVKWSECLENKKARAKEGWNESINNFELIWGSFCFWKKESSPPPNPSDHRKNAEGNYHSSGRPMWESDRHGVLEATLPRTRYQQRRHPWRLRHSGPISNLHFWFALSKHRAFVLSLMPSC